MGVYNEFRVPLPAPDGSTVEYDFQADVGVLEYRTIQLGEPILDAPADKLRGTIGPSLEALTSGRPFWAYGIAYRPEEGRQRFARLRFRDGRFAAAEPIDEPDDLYDWGFEDE